MEEWRIHINKICCEKFLLNKKISTFFRRKWEKSCTLGILSYLRRIYAFFRVALVPPTNFFIFSVSLHEVVLFGCSIATITRKFIFADFLGSKLGTSRKLSHFDDFWRFFWLFSATLRYKQALKWHDLDIATSDLTFEVIFTSIWAFMAIFCSELRQFGCILSLFWALWGLIFAYSGGQVCPKCLKCLGNCHGRMKNSY